MAALESTVIFLGAAVVAVPIFKRLKLGAILGYLVAGALIGPSVLNLVTDPDTILHVAELGVILLLFLIGIELEPQKLWRLRNAIVLTGGGQLLISAGLIAAIVFYLFADGPAAIVIALALALSSTAFAIQLMKEHRVLKTPPGQQGFGILLLQDLAVIPVLLLVEGLAHTTSSAPPWYLSVAAIVAVLVIGRFLLNPFLGLVSRYGSDESMTAAALLIVLATAFGMEAAGLSMGMGAFIAGIMLANSSFRHQLETEVEPFKGLLLGLFFIAIGMNLNLQLLSDQPLFIVGAAVSLVILKTGVIWLLIRLSGQSSKDALHIGLMLSQGGEFAFVVMTQAVGNSLIDPQIASQVTLIVGVSMALTAPLVILHSQFFSTDNCPRVYDEVGEHDEPAVIIAGFGRFGQITGRILAANDIHFTALDNDAQHIEFVKKFGNRVFYGDAARLDLLKMAGIDHARVLLVALDSEEQSLRVVELVRENYPDVRIVVRAHNRFSVDLFRRLGVHSIVRELAAGSLNAADQVLQEYGYDDLAAARMVQIFEHHDEESLEASLAMQGDIEALIDHSRYSREHLANLFQEDRDKLSAST